MGAKNPSVNADKGKKNGKIVCQMCEQQGQQSCGLSLAECGTSVMPLIRMQSRAWYSRVVRAKNTYGSTMLVVVCMSLT